METPKSAKFEFWLLNNFSLANANWYKIAFIYTSWINTVIYTFTNSYKQIPVKRYISECELLFNMLKYYIFMCMFVCTYV